MTSSFFTEDEEKTRTTRLEWIPVISPVQVGQPIQLFNTATGQFNDHVDFISKIEHQFVVSIEKFDDYGIEHKIAKYRQVKLVMMRPVTKRYCNKLPVNRRYHDDKLDLWYEIRTIIEDKGIQKRITHTQNVIIDKYLQSDLNLFYHNNCDKNDSFIFPQYGYCENIVDQVPFLENTRHSDKSMLLLGKPFFGLMPTPVNGITELFDIHGSYMGRLIAGGYVERDFADLLNDYEPTGFVQVNLLADEYTIQASKKYSLGSPFMFSSYSHRLKLDKVAEQGQR